MTINSEYKSQKASLSIPTLTFPIKCAEVFSVWYNEEPDVSRLPAHLIGTGFAISLIPIAMSIDLTIGTIAVLSSLVNQKKKIKLKQMAWDCLICGSFGGIVTGAQIIKKTLKNL